jgi:flagellar biosynthetic protein FlhB
MADTDNDQKTEQASERHLQEALEQGRFVKVPELSVLLILVAALFALAFTAQASTDRLARFCMTSFSGFASTPVRSDTVTAMVGEMILVGGAVALPMVVACAGAAMLAGGLQTGFRLTPKAIGLNWGKLDIAEGFGRIFSAKAGVHTAIDLLKLVAIGGSLYAGAKTLVHDPLFNSPVDTAYLGRFMYNSATAFLTRIALALAAIAAISFAYEKYKTSRELMMTRQEVKDERRSTEGDAMLKGSRRRLARRLLQKQMLKAVPTADVVITNPTHYAVALKYERGKDKAPIVLAKGENRFALRIKELAAEHGVPTVEDKTVARLLFAMGKVGEAIPAELYQGVAQILAVVYRTHRYYFHRLKSRRLEVSA